MDRPGLKALLAEIDRGQVDIVVVYKVDRLTRSLTDFARIVDVLDKKGASFVSVTQQFNTTTSMGRLTLNVLLSFAQFEREVTGERIRDKIAASKRKGMWMGGFPPLGYDILNRKLAVNETEAEIVRGIFQRYLELGSIAELALDLRRRNVTSKQWKTRHGATRGGHAFSRGALNHLLRNRIYRGEIGHKGEIHAGEHPGIVPQELWDSIQAKLSGKRAGPKPRARTGSSYLLAGLLFDDRGNRMTPSHVKKRNGQRYRYYVSQALLQRRRDQAGTLARVQAQAIDDLVNDRLGRLRLGSRDADANETQRTLSSSNLQALVARIEVSSRRITIALRKAAIDLGMEVIRQRLGENHQIDEERDVYQLTVLIRISSWGGETVLEGPNGEAAIAAAHLDASLLNALVKAIGWREQMASGEVRRIEQIAHREGCDESHVRHLLGLAFLAPDIIERILLGKQPRQVTLDRLVRMDLPMRWADQRAMLGISDARQSQNRTTKLAARA